MSAKKKEKSEWKLCATCHCYFPRGTCIKHEKSCADNLENQNDGDNMKSDQPISNNTERILHSGFIQDGILRGICKYIDHSKDDILPTSKDDLVLVHPSALKICDFKITSSVVVKYNGKQTCGTVWPSSSIPVDGVGLKLSKIKTLHIDEGSIVSVLVLDCPWIIANKLFLDPQNHSARINFDNISKALLDDLEDANVMTGDVVSISYYNEEIFYLVSDIHGDLTSESDVNSEEIVGDTVIVDNIREKEACDTDQFVVNTEQVFGESELVELDRKFVSLSVDEESTYQNGNSGEINSFNVFVYNVMSHSTLLVLNDDKRDPSDVQNSVQAPTAINTIGGLSPQIKLLEELVEFPFTYPSLYNQCGIAPPNGIILYGVSGTGKTTLAHAFVNKLSNVHSETINGPELTSKFHGETEQKLRDIFYRTMSKAPSVLIIDEFDAICPMRTGSSSESEKRVVATLLTLLDGIKKGILFVVIAITSKLDQIDMALRRPGRFDREIEIGVPNVHRRSDVIQKLLLECRHSLSQEDITELSEVTHGYVGADLSALTKEAGMIAMKKLMDVVNIGDKTGMSTNVDELAKDFSISVNDFWSALCTIRPSAMKAVMIDIPKIYWKDIGGQHHVKQKMKEAIEWPLKHPGVFKRLGITPPRGLLMYGPPGCSKTLIAKALATESGLNFISIKGPELFNKYLGESERAIREVFRKARISAPSIIFFDEIDALGVQRSNKDGGSGNVGDRVLAQLLTELDGIESLEGVVIIAATNRPDIIDPALLRPGRIDRLVYVPLPDNETRKEIFDIQFRSIPVSEDVDLNSLVKMSEGYSGAEICSLCREAAITALRENFDSDKITFAHFQNVFDQIKPATSTENVKFYRDYMNKTTGSF